RGRCRDRGRGGGLRRPPLVVRHRRRGLRVDPARQRSGPRARLPRTSAHCRRVRPGLRPRTATAPATAAPPSAPPPPPAGLRAAVRRIPLTDVLAPAIRLARDGFALDDAPHLRQQIERQRDLLAADPGLRAILLTKDGQPPGPGFRIVQRDLARTLENVAGH